MSEEYVSTFVEADDSDIPESSAVDKTEPSKRAYAFGANRRSQLKTTDLFPKKLWVIALCGLILLGLVAGLNVLNAYAPDWRPYIGEGSVRAIALSGPGTLASWMLSMMLLLTGLASAQIFALRQHRCDDYGGTYRIWLIVPPIFLVASIASIVDFESIIFHLGALAQLSSATNESLIPMTIKLSLLALIMVRMLFEIRDSKAAFSMLVVAWLAIAVSTVLNTQWAENRIASQELAMAYPNATLVAAIALMLSHLLYVRFVYLHAHGAIAVKKRSTPKGKAKVKPTRRAKATKAKQAVSAPVTAQHTPTESVTVEKVAEGKTRKRSRKKTAQAVSKTTPQQQPIVTPAAETKAAAPQPDSNSASKKSTTMSDFQTLLKQRQAEKAAAQVSPAVAPLDSTRDDTNNGEAVKMSKAERRRARKAAKSKRRAA